MCLAIVIAADCCPRAGAGAHKSYKSQPGYGGVLVQLSPPYVYLNKFCFFAQAGFFRRRTTGPKWLAAQQLQLVAPLRRPRTVMNLVPLQVALTNRLNWALLTHILFPDPADASTDEDDVKIISGAGKGGKGKGKAKVYGLAGYGYAKAKAKAMAKAAHDACTSDRHIYSALLCKRLSS
jgi:hypothetical protein